MVDYCVSLEVVPPAIGDVGLFGLGFLLLGGAEEIVGGEPQAVRRHDGHEHVTILVVDIGQEVSVVLAGDATDLMIEDNLQRLEGVGVPPARELLGKLKEHEVPVYV